MKIQYQEALRDSKERWGVDAISDYDARRLVYLKGKIYLQAFAPISSTETRLEVVPPLEFIDYGRSEPYEDLFFYHNKVSRVYGIYANPSADLRIGFDHCADCSLEYQIWRAYHAFGEDNKKNSKIIRQDADDLSRILRKSLLRDSHGCMRAQL